MSRPILILSPYFLLKLNNKNLKKFFQFCFFYCVTKVNKIFFDMLAVQKVLSRQSGGPNKRCGADRQDFSGSPEAIWMKPSAIDAELSPYSCEP